MRKILSALFILMVAFLFVGCGEKPEPEPEVKKYTVEFVVDGKTVDTQQVEEGKSATAPSDPKKEGFEFKGWDKEFTNVKSDLEINAIFEEVKIYHTVEFLVEGKVYATVKVEHGKAAELPEQPTVEGKYFAGWLKDTSNVVEDMKVRSKFVEVSLEPKAVKNFPFQIGKAPFTRYINGSAGYDTDASLYTSKIFLIQGSGNGNSWWYRIFIKNIDGANRVVEVAPRGASQTTTVCDWTILCYTDALAEVLASTGVKEGDLINFSKHPTAFTETTNCEEFFTVSRLTDMEAYILDSDTAHTVVALHKMKKYFEGLGEKISLDKIDLPAFDGETTADIVWTSSNLDIIALDGTVNLPDEVVEVTLTAVATFGTSTYKQTYVLRVGK